MTCVLDFWDKITIVDRAPKGTLGGKAVKEFNGIKWNLVDAVILSSFVYQKEMENELSAMSGFCGEIVRLYNDKDISQFFDLQKETDFLVLEKVESWDDAVKKSKAGYADESIIQFDYENFVERRKKSEENKKNEKRHYYDLLFYILKTIVQLKKDEVDVLDFGGGFGGVFYDMKYYLKNLNIKINWMIIEQEKIIEWSVKEIANTGIVYRKNLQEIKEEENVDFVLLGSSIQYLEDYKKVILAVKELNPKRIAFLKTPVSDETFVNVQHVNNKGNYNYYTADYACRVLAEDELVLLLSDKYRLEDSAEDLFNSDNNSLDTHTVKWKDFFFERNIE